MKTARKFWHTEGFRGSNWTLSAVGTDRISRQRRPSEWQLMVIVSLPNQSLHTGRDPELEVENTCSTRKKWNGILTVKILLILCINFSFSRIIKDVNSLYKKMPNTEYLVWSGFEAFLAFGRASGNPEESSEILSEDRLSFKTLINHHCYETFMPDLCLLSLISSTLHFPAHIHKY